MNLQGGNQQTITINPGAANAAGAFDRRFELRVTAAGPFDVTAGLIDPICTDPIESAAEQAYRQALRNAQSAEQARANARRALDEAQRAVDNFESDYGEALAARAVANRDGDAAGAARAEADREQAWQNLEAARRLRNQRQYQLEQASREEVEALDAVREASAAITEAQREAISREEIARAYDQRCGIR